MADGEYNVTRISITDDVSIVYGSTPNGDKFLAIQDGGDDPGSASVPVDKLPALLDALQTAAEGMGVSTETQRLRFENKQRQDFIEELLLTLHPKSVEIMRGRLAEMLQAEK